MRTSVCFHGHLQDGRFVLDDGSNPLVSDAEYTVTVTGTVKEFGLSGITDSSSEQIHTFTTVTTPMPIVPKDGLKVKYGEEARIEWNIPVSRLRVQLSTAFRRTMRTGRGWARGLYHPGQVRAGQGISR